MSPLSVVTWNVHGGIARDGGTIAISGSIAPHAPDLVALQEFPDARVASIARMEAELGLSHSAYWEVGSEDQTGLAVFSRWPLRNVRSLVADAPPESVTRSGAGLTPHRKGALVVDVQRGQDSLRFASVHLLPFHIFGLDEDRLEARRIWMRLASEIVTGAPRTVIVCGDFNGPPSLRLAPRALQNDLVQSAIGSRGTRDDGRSHDDVLFGSGYRLAGVQVIETESDHHLCAVRLVKADAES
jgi:endonuclease/exonuclease/phosphatase family metal-dependent hydrolase